MSTEKESQHQHDENILVTWFNERFGFLRPHFKTIAICAGMLVLAGLLYMITRQFRHDANAQQWNMHYTSLCRSVIEQRPAHLVDMADELGEETASLWATQMSGNVELRRGLTELGDDREAALKKIKTAKKNFEAVVNSSLEKSPMLQEQSVFGLARACEVLGDREDARQYYQQIIESAPDSLYVKRAQEGVQRATDENLVAFLEAFSSADFGAAPGLALPPKVDISFPALDAASGEFPLTQPGDGAPTAE